MLEQAKNITKGQILVLDDEESLRVTIGAFLREMGFTVETAADADEALDLISRKLPDLVLCDLILPEKNGEYVISELRAKYPPDLNISVMTGMPDDRNEKLLREKYRIASYHPKPFTRKDIRLVVDRLFGLD